MANVGKSCCQAGKKNRTEGAARCVHTHRRYGGLKSTLPSHTQRDEEETLKLEKEYIEALDRTDRQRHATFQKIVAKQAAKESTFNETTQEIIRRQVHAEYIIIEDLSVSFSLLPVCAFLFADSKGMYACMFFITVTS